MQFYLDTADVSEIRQLLDVYPCAGVTTNPSIIARTRRPFFDLLNELAEVVTGSMSLFVQVVGEDAQTMLQEARLLSEIVPQNLVIKVPVTTEGFKAMRGLKQQRIPFAATAILTPLQALLAAEAGASFVAPYVSRSDSLQCDGVDLVAKIVTILGQGNYATKVLAASFKTTQQISQMALVGCQSVTVSPELMRSVVQHPMTDSSIAKFSSDWSGLYEGAQSIVDTQAH